MRMSLILVATVGGVLLEQLRRCPPDGRVGHAGAERGPRPATVRGPPTAVFDRPLCQTAAAAFIQTAGRPPVPPARAAPRPARPPGSSVSGPAPPLPPTAAPARRRPRRASRV